MHDSKWIQFNARFARSKNYMYYQMPNKLPIKGYFGRCLHFLTYFVGCLHLPQQCL